MRSIRRISFWFITGFTLTLAGVARADMLSLSATHDPLAPNFFQVDFHDGSPRSATISATNFGLNIDDVAGTAQFTGYQQSIDPLEVFPGVSTGPIAVTIIASELGAYEPLTGVFTTTDSYRITFDDSQLAAYGITSPVDLLSTSQGTITFGEGRSVNTIDMQWDGQGVIAELPFDYFCRVSTNFEVVPEPAALALFGLVAAVGPLRRQRRR